MDNVREFLEQWMEDVVVQYEMAVEAQKVDELDQLKA